MRTVRSLLLSAAAMPLLLTACFSGPVTDTSYYLLENQAGQFMGEMQPVPERVIVLQLHELSDYLSQPYLVMQTGAHRLQYARLHMWAEPLSDGISKALLSDLNGGQSTARFIRRGQGALPSGSQVLTVEVERFHVDAESQVILTGQYWLAGEAVQPFFLRRRLKDDGFPHSVATMRALLGELADQALSSLDLSPTE